MDWARESKEVSCTFETLLALLDFFMKKTPSKLTLPNHQTTLQNKPYPFKNVTHSSAQLWSPLQALETKAPPSSGLARATSLTAAGLYPIVNCVALLRPKRVLQPDMAASSLVAKQIRAPVLTGGLLSARKPSFCFCKGTVPSAS